MSDQPPPNQPPPTLAEPWKYLCHHLVRDWSVILAAPIAVLAVLAISLFLAREFVWLVVVPAKEEQLKSKDATIQQKDATIQQLQTVLAVNGLNTFPLKKRANILAGQLEDYVRSFPTNFQEELNYSMTFGDRFLDRRVPNLLYELDQQGVHSTELDSNSPLWQNMRSNPLKPEPIAKLASIIRSLAAQLRD